MYIFLIALLPIVFIAFFIISNSLSLSKGESLMVYVYGLILGLVWMVIQMLSVSEASSLIDSFIKIAFPLWLKQFLLPVIVSFIVLLIISKNEISYKVSVFPIFLLGFYSVCLPYWGYTYQLDSSYFILLVKPCFIALMLITMISCFSVISRLEILSSPSIISIVIAVISSLVPFAIEGLWYVGCNVIAIIISFIISILLLIFSGFVKRL